MGHKYTKLLEMINILVIKVIISDNRTIQSFMMMSSM